MKFVLIATTVNVPSVLAAYRDAAGIDTSFIVAGDLKSPHKDIERFLGKLGLVHYLHPDDQKRWACSELLGWNTIARRNIALLEAIALKPDAIVSIDDDNIPLDRDFLVDIRRAFERWHALEAVPADNLYPVFFDPGHPVRQRGVPHGHVSPAWHRPSLDLKVGVVQGLVFGDPDINAYTRLASNPVAHAVSDTYRAGIVFRPSYSRWTVFNTQATAFLAELAPAMFCPPRVGRHDEIVASLITQFVMRSKNLFVHFGRPLVWQARNEHDLLKDLHDELWGYEHVPHLAERLDRFDGSEEIGLRDVWKSFRDLSWFPLLAI